MGLRWVSVGTQWEDRRNEVGVWCYYPGRISGGLAEGDGRDYGASMTHRG
ncbi:MAG: hypothetical protein H7X99_11995 [Saprospiraceae bacterium]|nr:hypothetical protein [Saprospiraceae bacterium]